MNDSPLTQKQDIVFRALKDYYMEFNRMPTLRGLQDWLKMYGLELKSVRSVGQYLDALKDKGIIERSSEPRGIQIKKLQYEPYYKPLPYEVLLERIDELERRVTKMKEDNE